MSAGSCCSQQCRRLCGCGLTASYFTAWTHSNAGRKFYRCPKPDRYSCGYWEWEDEKFPDRAVIVIKELKTSLDVAVKQNCKLKEQVEAMESLNQLKDIKIRNLEEKSLKLQRITLILLVLIVGFIGARLMN